MFYTEKDKFHFSKIMGELSVTIFYAFFFQ